ncbi:uncharacterized protein ACLA_052960 [Aspergillus clavatus NRRL 1]|uniref:Uncharacterized protein n=1 Tax=Aspergillus clavatus (strain ATCC 1007 / CBS 513.65 / DSM 816 / NCTC 3887 / NRRL 1 / QM 1276 / 107) TaxID=344612 RepID=A1CIW8_ASPCL|nr:uncharacterized protein ACLA_052960 [Aspergillus clavatus NRRL 1]EAW10823.1 hypothetical protein ACLA_052960 [Aspergillus clavatus NRRL 1]
MFSTIRTWLFVALRLLKLKHTRSKWEKVLKKAKTPKDYESFLLSDLDSRAKARLIYRISLQKGLPNHLFGNQDKVDHLVTRLEKQGLYQTGRLLRFFQYHHQPPDPEAMHWCQDLIEHERTCNIIAQSLAFYQSAHKALNEDRNPDKRRRLASALEHARDSLEELKSLYREVKAELMTHLGNMPGGPFRKAFLAWRNETNWHLCDWMRQDCVARGGCCARECGCCEKPRGTGGYGYPIHGHCTLLCACCAQTNGLPVMDENAQCNVNLWEDIERFMVDQTDMYSRRAYRAYIWGVDVVNEIEDCDVYLRQHPRSLV